MRIFLASVAATALLVGALAWRSSAERDGLTAQFDEAVALLQAKRFDEATIAWQHVVQRAPQLPEAHVNLGFALLGAKRPADARRHFDRATALRPAQANAYYGLALAWEASGDLAMATGAMRSYLHLAKAENPEHLRRARSALWEWEQARPK